MPRRKDRDSAETQRAAKSFPKVKHMSTRANFSVTINDENQPNSADSERINKLKIFNEAATPPTHTINFPTTITNRSAFEPLSDITNSTTSRDFMRPTVGLAYRCNNKGGDTSGGGEGDVAASGINGSESGIHLPPMLLIPKHSHHYKELTPMLATVLDEPGTTETIRRLVSDSKENIEEGDSADEDKSPIALPYDSIRLHRVPSMSRLPECLQSEFAYHQDSLIYPNPNSHRGSTLRSNHDKDSSDEHHDSDSSDQNSDENIDQNNRTVEESLSF